MRIIETDTGWNIALYIPYIRIKIYIYSALKNAKHSISHIHIIIMSESEVQLERIPNQVGTAIISVLDGRVVKVGDEKSR